MGPSTVTAGRIYAGQKLGKLGEEHQLSFEKFDNVGLLKTYNVDKQVRKLNLLLPLDSVWIFRVFFSMNVTGG